jgi:hypothetical protein
VRTASGIAVVAVMCKPHRCPHIAMTGNVCVYCLADDAQVLTNRGFMGRAQLQRALNIDDGRTGRIPVGGCGGDGNAGDADADPLLVAGYDAATGHLLYERPTGFILNAPKLQTMVEFTQAHEYVVLVCCLVCRCFWMLHVGSVARSCADFLPAPPHFILFFFGCTPFAPRAGLRGGHVTTPAVAMTATAMTVVAACRWW